MIQNILLSNGSKTCGVQLDLPLKPHNTPERINVEMKKQGLYYSDQWRITKAWSSD